MSSRSDVRRAAAQKAFDRVRSAGLSPEGEQIFHEWIEAWINSEMTMDEVRKRYQALLLVRRDARKLGGVTSGQAHAPDHKAADYAHMSVDQLIDEVTRLTEADETDR